MPTFNLETIMTMDQEKIDSLNLMSKTNSVWVNKKELVLTGIYFVGKSKVIITEYPNTVKPYPYQLINDITGIKAKAFDLFALNHSEIADFIHIYLKNHGLFINFLDERKDNQELRQKNTELNISIDKLVKANKEILAKNKQMKKQLKTLKIDEIRKDMANILNNSRKNVLNKTSIEIEKIEKEIDEKSKIFNDLKENTENWKKYKLEIVNLCEKLDLLRIENEESNIDDTIKIYYKKNEKLQEKVRDWKKYKVENDSWKK